VEVKRVTIPVPDGDDIIIETGRMAKQANASTVITAGETVVLCAATAADPRPYLDFFPLTVEYREQSYAAGKIPGGFFKRQGRPYAKEVIGCRMTDRPCRPLFPKGFKNDVQLINNVLSYDLKNEGDILAILGSSASLTISDIPFDGPIGAVRIGYIDGKFVVNFPLADSASSDLDLVVAGTEGAITMVECQAKNVPESLIVDALELAHEHIQLQCRAQNELREMCGKPKFEYTTDLHTEELEAEVAQLAMPKIIEASSERGGKFAVNAKVDEAKAILDEHFAERIANEEVTKKHVRAALESTLNKNFRRLLLEEDTRPDGRGSKEVRPISIELGVLPRVHGSALFTRGETQSLGVLTLGISEDEQIIESLLPTYRDRFLLHYNFPSFSVGECRPIRSPGRREIGHGMLARRALENVLPDKLAFPYTMRVVSEILESNGSSSMATICSGSLSMMDAGVPLREPVAGIAMGLVMGEDGKYAILTDIQGAEDHYGDMDFKVGGTKTGITALQMDIKLKGLPRHIMEEALAQAKEARLHILDIMNEALAEPRSDLSPYAPRIYSIPIKPEKIGAVIGPQGKVIRHIVDTCGVKVEIDDVANRVNIVSNDEAAAEKAKAMVSAIIEEPEIGKIYNGRVVRVTKFGAFVEILPHQDGLVHISELDFGHVARTEDVCNIGDVIPVKLVNIDDLGRINLSRRAALEETGQGGDAAKRPERSGRDGNRESQGSRSGRDSRPPSRGPRGDR